MKKVVISCGPIPARLDSVKFITNRFKGGLAFKTAQYLMDRGYPLTIIVWNHTSIPQELKKAEIIKVKDVFDYYDWFSAHAAEYEAFIMAAAVANLTPSSPFSGKFPSHQYKVGEQFDLTFEIAPRAIDVIKKVNPRATLIGYKLFDTEDDQELAEIAYHTLQDAKANIIFANRPSDAKTRKLAVMADHSVIPMTFEEHLEMIDRCLQLSYFKTKVTPLTEKEKSDIRIRKAMAIVTMFEKTFPQFGTVAIPIEGTDMFATTSRGHRGGVVLVRKADSVTDTIYASGKATLNAPMLYHVLKAFGNGCSYLIHRHSDDPRYQPDHDMPAAKMYQFPGTYEEVVATNTAIFNHGLTAKKEWRLILPFHGDLTLHSLKDVNWEKYHQQFPPKYFSIPEEMSAFIEQHKTEHSLELGANKEAMLPYAYDPNVLAKNAINVLNPERMNWGLVVAKNAINYMELDFLKDILAHCKYFIANTFAAAPKEKVTDCETAVLDEDQQMIHHTLLLPDDQLLEHTFHAYSEEDYQKLGLKTKHYGRNSLLVFKE